MTTLQWLPGSPSAEVNPPAPSATGATDQDIWFGVSLGLLGVIVGFGLGKWQAQPSAAATLTVPPVDLANDHIRGSKDAEIAVIEYSDFECPFCKRIHPTYKQITQQYDGKVMWVFRHFPLSFHRNAQKEAEASECAAELGGNEAFWKFADGIIDKTTSNGTGFPLDRLPVLAAQIGLDEQKFRSCLDSGRYAGKVKRDEDGGTAGGVTGTPGNFVVNLTTKKAQQVTGAQPFEKFKSAIDALLP